MAWTEKEHLQDPCVNCNLEFEGPLAQAVAGILRDRQEMKKLLRTPPGFVFGNPKSKRGKKKRGKKA